jgi:hypothetical protein
MTALAVEISITGQEFMLVGRSSSNSQRRFHRRGPTVIKLDSREIARQYFTKPFQEAQFDWCSEIMAVHELTGSVLHGSSDLWVAVPQGSDINARGKIEVGVPVHIRQRATMATLENYRAKGYLAGVAFHELRSSAMYLLRLGTGHVSYYARISGQVDRSPFYAGHSGLGRGGKQGHELLR